MPRHLSLFTGVGGFDLGFERAGFESVGQVESDQKCREVLDRRWPNIPKHDDVQTAADWVQEHGMVGRVSILSAGFPCQDVSVAGRRAGLAGRRSGLFFDALAIAEQTKAEWFVLENVPGLLSSNGGRDFGTVISEMANAGYRHIEWRVLDSQFFGVPQRRRRVFIVGCSRELGQRKVFVESEGVRGDTATGDSQRPLITTALTGSLGSGGPDDNQAQGNQLVPTRISSVVPNMRAASAEAHLIPTVAATLQGGNDGGFRAEPGDHIVPFVKARRAKDDEDYETWEERPVSTTLNAFDNHTDVRATVLATSKMGVRRLTPTECERLQGFPDGWTEGCADTTRYHQMGNAVTVNVAEYVGTCILDVIRG